MPLPPRVAKVVDSAKNGYTYSIENSKPIFFRKPDEIQGDNILEKAANVAGMAAGDVASDATRGMYWRFNHVLAPTQAIGQWVGKQAGLGAIGATTMGFAAATAMDATSGNVNWGNLGEAGRPKGYAAVYASEDDPTKTENYGAELATRWLLGRTGKLLPYEQFVKERPDVTPEEYAQHQDYVRSPGILGGIVKGTTDGIDGVEGMAFGYRVPASAALQTGGMLAGALAGAKLENPRIAKVGRMGLGGLAGLAAGRVLGSFVDGQ